MSVAHEWCRTDPAACVDDVERLGLDRAVEYQMELIEQCRERGDNRWDDATADDIRDALIDLCDLEER